VCEVGYTDSWRVRKKTLNAFTKWILVCYAFVSIKFNGIFKFSGTVKIREFDTCSRCKSRDGGYRVSYGSTLKLSGGTHLYGVYKY